MGVSSYVASTYPPETVEAAGLDCGIPSFVIAKAVDHKGPKGTDAVDWILNPGRNGIAPRPAFQQALLDASEQWHKRNKTGQTGEQDNSSDSE